jgi:hypothetical protein
LWVGLGLYVAFWDIALICLFGLVRRRLLDGIYGDVRIAVLAVARGVHVAGG